MGTALSNISNINTSLTDKELRFIEEYMISSNGTQAVQLAGYKTKSPSRYASDLLRKSSVREEIQRRIEERESRMVAKPAEILQFYTSVMRGEVQDQFGIEASLDTRIKAANELAKHQIEIPLKLEQKNITNNIGTIQLNFLPRNQEI
jgi:phage terminase small subunit